MLNVDKLLDVASEFRIAALKAKKVGIISLVNEQFLIHNKGKFKEIVEGRKYDILPYNKDYKYNYIVTIKGMDFFCLTNDLLYPGDFEIVNNEDWGVDEWRP